MEEWSSWWETTSTLYYKQKLLLEAEHSGQTSASGGGEGRKVDRPLTGGPMEENRAWRQLPSQILSSLHVELFKPQLKTNEQKLTCISHDRCPFPCFWTICILCLLCFLISIFFHFLHFPWLDRYDLETFFLQRFRRHSASRLDKRVSLGGSPTCMWTQPLGINPSSPCANLQPGTCPQGTYKNKHCFIGLMKTMISLPRRAHTSADLGLPSPTRTWLPALTTNGALHCYAFTFTLGLFSPRTGSSNTFEEPCKNVNGSDAVSKRWSVTENLSIRLYLDRPLERGLWVLYTVRV